MGFVADVVSCCNFLGFDFYVAWRAIVLVLGLRFGDWLGGAGFAGLGCVVCCWVFWRLLWIWLCLL